jgi:Electron transfer DM13
MAIHISPWLLRRKWVLLGVGLPILVVLWWAFRPEKLWINQKVNEPAPFDASGDPQPILTGRFDGTPAQTSGRATIYRKPGGEEYLQLKDFTAPSGANVHVVLARSQDLNPSQAVANGGLDTVDLGPLRADQGDQIYDLPAGADLTKYDAVAIYGENDHTVFGRAKLEPF